MYCSRSSVRVYHNLGAVFGATSGMRTSNGPLVRRVAFHYEELIGFELLHTRVLFTGVVSGQNSEFVRPPVCLSDPIISDPNYWNEHEHQACNRIL